MKVYAIIGAGYGDEGKGMWTNYRARTQENPIVIRVNGSAQAGHTVVKNNKRYIFSHLGCGTLENVPTFFSRYSVVNPLLFQEEITSRHPGLNPTVFVEPQTQVTTPYDMLVNQVLETRRGDERHGSCGLGFGATLQRVEDGLSLTYADLLEDDLEAKINKIRLYCLDQLGKCNGYSKATKENEFFEFLTEKTMMKRFLTDCYKFISDTRVATVFDLKKYQTLIFENAQGLLLDQDYGDFPHVTRSSTGFRNVKSLLQKFTSLDKLDITVDYISRCYVTRHGAGPLANEVHSLEGIIANDPTNHQNRYQGALRFAPLDIGRLREACWWDRSIHPLNVKINKIVTCVDQVIGPRVDIVWNHSSKVESASKELFIYALKAEFNTLVSNPEGPKT
jgi:adenylosuccinate synthase